MVHAILDGRKTQTRRIIKKQPVFDIDSGYKYWDNLMFDLHDDVLETMYMPDHCPYGDPGDILWVRETWRPTTFSMPTGWPYDYRATAKEDGVPEEGPWKPSIFMPKEACRIKLEITDIGVERLNDISEGDAIKEGVGHGFQMNGGWPDYEHIKNGVCTLTQDTAAMSFASLWEKINGKGSWGKNPWVWVIEFKSFTSHLSA